MKNLFAYCSVPAIAILLTISGCKEKVHTEYEFPSGGGEKSSEKEIEGYPSSLKVINFTHDLGFADKCVGWYAIADMKAENHPVFSVRHQAPAKKPSEIFSQLKKEGKKPYIVTNAGYFWAGKSLSVCIHNNELKSIASKTANARGGKTAYPVRAAFGALADGKFCATWVYCPTDGGDKPYSYPSPLDNDEKLGQFMTNMPSSKTEGAVLWQPSEGIGGGPMLVKDGKNVAMDYYWREVLDAGGTGGTSRQSRTAIGATKDGKLIILVCDGRGMNDSKGFTLKELADKLISLGADIAINLDGGGSSTFVGMDGEVKNRPSDSGSSPNVVQRAVPTAIVLSEK